MHPLLRGGLRAGIAIVALAALPSRAAAQDETAIAAARSLAQEGAVAAKAGRCDEAVDKLSRAKRIIAAPTILVPLGECQIALGRIVVGTENLQAAAREILAADAPKAFVEAQNRARQILPEALKKLARLRVDVVAPAGVSFTVTDNEAPVADALLGVDRPADPTKHVVVVKAQGYLTATKEITLESGQREVIELKLEPDPNAPKEPPSPPGGGPSGPPGQPTPPQPNPPPNPEGSNGLVIGGAVALAFGGAGLIVGGVFGGLASSKKSSLDEVCTGEKLCPSASQGDIDDMNTFANVSTSMFVVGGVGAALGATLLGVGLAGSSAEGTTALRFGPTGISLEGSF
jgi:hypothetical protein